MKMDRELYNLKTKILRSKHISDQVREELANDVFEIEKKVKKLTLADVNQQRELLAFRKWQKDNWKDVYLYSDEFMISEFKKANCG